MSLPAAVHRAVWEQEPPPAPALREARRPRSRHTLHRQAQKYLYFLHAFLLPGIHLLLHTLTPQQGFQGGAFRGEAILLQGQLHFCKVRTEKQGQAVRSKGGQEDQEGQGLALESTQELALWVGLEAACALTSGWNRSPGAGSGFPVSCFQPRRQMATLSVASEQRRAKGTRRTVAVNRPLNDPGARFCIHKVRTTMASTPTGPFVGHKHAPYVKVF